MRERQKKKKGRTWAEAAKTVLEKYPNTPMSHKEILQVIQRERLKEIRSGTSPLACLNAMLHTNSRGEEGIFYKVPGRMGVYTLKKDIADVVKEMSDEPSEDSSDNLSDTRSTENSNNNINNTEGRRGRWRRRVPAKLQSQPSPPQSRCSSPSVPSSKLISPSQKHSKKALKQALKQQQQRNQRRQCGITTGSSPRLLIKTVKDMADSTSSKSDVCHASGARKMSQRSSRLSARQLRRTKCEIDVETPDSILVNTNLRAIINKHTFSVLPTECQQRLLKLLPEVDQQSCMDGMLKLTSSALNNEFFTSAAQSWKERLAEGEFTPELRLRMRQEIEKEKKVEHWKERFFESYYGEKSGLSMEESQELTESSPVEAKIPVQPAEPEFKAETGQPSQVTEGSSRESSSKEEEVKSELIVSHSDTADTKLASQDPQLESVGTAKEEPSAVLERPAEEVLKAVTNVESVKSVTGVKAQESEIKPETPTSSPHHETLTSPKGKDAQAGEGERSPSEVSQVSMEERQVTSPMPAAVPEPLKRKACGDQEAELTPEKKPRMAQPETSPSTSSTPSTPTTPTPTAEQRVPPLKIPVSRILSGPVSGGQVSPRAPLPMTVPSPRPGRTGARTLADIKLKAQLAKAQRAAAAAAAGSSSSRGATPGPGPGGGTSTPSPAQSLSEELSPASSRSQSVSPIKVSSVSPTPEGTVTPAQFSPCSGSTRQIGLGFAQGQTSVNEGRPLMGSPNTQSTSESQRVPLLVGGTVPAPLKMSENVNQPSLQSLVNTGSLSYSQRPHETSTLGASVTKPSSSIPANNPLVTQLLQGKEVPLEKILPKPLSKTEVQNVSSFSRDIGLSTTARASSERLNSGDTGNSSRSGQQVSGCSVPSSRSGISTELTRHQPEMLDKDTQEQILQALMHRAQQSHTFSASRSQPSQYQSCQLGHLEGCQDQPRFPLGFFGRKRLSKPAMTGHYLLNVSTYGRGSESSKRPHLALTTSTALANLKKENVEGEEGAKDGEESLGTSHTSSGRPSNLSGVKVEQQGYSITKPDQGRGNQHCSGIKSEFPSISCSSLKEDSGLCAENISARTKETSHRMHLDTCSSKQGNSEPYQAAPHVGTDPSHQPLPPYQPQKTHDSQEPVIGTYYGGTISMSLPPALNHSNAGTVTSPTMTEDTEGGGSSGSVMSFSVTVTAIPAGHSLDQSDQAEASPEQTFMEGSGIEDVQSKCYCRLKAMIMCKGCGAFCHDDCIGPSKLCVSCLVVR
ncbi:putative Polycomb group protein ASXL2 isoform X2 [Chanos chanos]|uniref:Polycomb group protein ASXL2 isoform X2 n=1 Tax=Chanos chanos TaxID=29144 RepID=A0A6J2WBR7_CHACN|nr:putative Polycomb group protein ASXL2 isoform X2 [Chanos chanos]